MVPLAIIFVFNDKKHRSAGSSPVKVTINSPKSNHIDVQHAWFGKKHVAYFVV